MLRLKNEPEYSYLLNYAEATQVLFKFAYEAALRAEGNGDSIDFNQAYANLKKYWIVE